MYWDVKIASTSFLTRPTWLFPHIADPAFSVLPSRSMSLRGSAHKHKDAIFWL